jgi:SAM-dependent methyltransferase
MSARPDHSLEPAYFDAKYEQKLDYWDFETSPYEAEKYARTLAALPRESYARAFEIGCSIGVLTSLLAGRCARLFSVDVSALALDSARRRCAALPQVELQLMQFPRESPAGRFDLIVVSEVGYYWSRAELASARAALAGLLEPGGHLLLVHWTHYVSEYPLTGDEVHEAFLQDRAFSPLHAECTPDYRLDLLTTAR